MTNNKHLLKLQSLFALAQCPEDVFGGSADMVSATYKDMAKLCHPDLNREHPDKANEVFKSLGEWMAKAEERINDGTYGLRKKIAKVTVSWKEGTIGLFSMLRRTEQFTYYDGETNDGTPVTVKVSTPKTRSLLEREFKILQELDVKFPFDAKVWQPFPRPRGMFNMDIGKGVHVPAMILSKPQAQVYPFTRIREVHDKGVDLRDAAWMVNRLASLVERCNVMGIVHGCLNPQTVFVSPEHHTIFVEDWHTCTKYPGKGAGVVSGPMDCFVPPEVKNKGALGHCTDLYSVGALGLWLITDIVANKHTVFSSPTWVPTSLKGLLRTCLLDNDKARPYADACEFHEDWKKALYDLYGKPTFRPFHL